MKVITLVLLWLLGSATAIGVAWSGVGVLDDELVAPAPAVVTVDGEVGLASESVDPTLPTTATAGDDDADDDGPSSSTTATTERDTSTSSTMETTSTSSTATTVPTTDGTSTTTNSTTSTTGSTSSTTDTVTSVEPEPYETKTFTLTGGTTAIRFSPSYTKVLWATPNPGYEVRIEPEPPGIKVEFRSESHRSRIDAWWDDGPRHEIREED